MYFSDLLGKDLGSDLPNYSKLVHEFYAWRFFNRMMALPT